MMWNKRNDMIWKKNNEFHNEINIVIIDTNKMIDSYNLLTNSDSFILNQEIRDEIKSYNNFVLSTKTKKIDQVITCIKEHSNDKKLDVCSSPASVRFEHKIHFFDNILKLLESAIYFQSTQKVPSLGYIFNSYINKLNHLKDCGFVYTKTEMKLNVTKLINSYCNYYIVGTCKIDEDSFYEKNFLLGLLLDLQGRCLRTLDNLAPYYIHNVMSSKKIGDFGIDRFYIPESDMELYNFCYNMIYYTHNIIKHHYNIETNFKEIKLTLK